MMQVLFNIGGPALNQLQNAANKPKSGAVKKAQKAVSKATKRRAAAAAIAGLSAASLLAAAPQAEAAQEIAQLAAGEGSVLHGLLHACLGAAHARARCSQAWRAGDNRFGIIATLFLPVIGWVAFNIGGPALNQLQNTGKLAGAGGKVGRKGR
jgi:photosystem II PsbY protein